MGTVAILAQGIKELALPMVTRLSFRRHVSWNTASNKRRLVKTPGGKLTYLHVKKSAKPQICGDLKTPLQGVKRVRPAAMGRLVKRQKKVQRAYGGCLSGKAVRTRILRAFLIEEQQCVKRVLQAKKPEGDSPAKAKKSGKAKK